MSEENQVQSPIENVKRAVVVAGGSTLPKADLVIVVEARTVEAGEVVVKKDGYPKGADIYLRYEASTKFPAGKAEVFTMGLDLQQLNFGGFTRQEGYVNVGPAHPAFAAANLAYQRGATDIEIVGLSDAEKARLQPYLDALPHDAAAPAQVTVRLT